MNRRQLLLALAASVVLLPARSQERVIRIVAKKFEYNPAEITLEKGVPVVLELTSEDVTMGFLATDFKVDVEIVPGKVAQVRLLPDKTGTFDFSCNVFCGEGHEDMGGKIHVA
ncbi:MAG TPA: cupredoxin domain-containing protein [Burkholderiales bacterium]